MQTFSLRKHPEFLDRRWLTRVQYECWRFSNNALKPAWLDLRNLEEEDEEKEDKHDHQ